ncbi:DegV family protein [Mycoplasma todarodis]|uniref:DegV family protein n=1 Tax=Mycoplasma todarodis TaxID=1937191 RepID=UPI003B2C9422
MKLGIIVDSSSGLSKKEAEDRGWGFIPLHIFLDKVDYADGIDITTQGVYDKLTLETEVRTSASAPGEVLAEFERMTDKYDHIIVYPLSSELSSQTNNLKMFAKEFSNIHIIESHGLSKINVVQCEKAERMAKEGKEIEEILDTLHNSRDDYFAVLLPHSLDWLVKGGRVGSTVASMATMLKIVPMISFAQGELNKYGKGRTFQKTVTKAAKDTINKFGADNCDLYVYHVGNKDIKEHLQRIETATGKKPIEIYLPSAIALHVGLEAVGIMALKK